MDILFENGDPILNLLKGQVKNNEVNVWQSGQKIKSSVFLECPFFLDPSTSKWPKGVGFWLASLFLTWPLKFSECRAVDGTHCYHPRSFSACLLVCKNLQLLLCNYNAATLDSYGIVVKTALLLTVMVSYSWLWAKPILSKTPSCKESARQNKY